MKIVLTTTTTFLIAILIIGLLGINNINNNSNNINNAFAQEGNSEIPPLVEPDRNISIMSMPTNAANQSQPMMDLNGTINIKSTIAEAF